MDIKKAAISISMMVDEWYSVPNPGPIPVVTIERRLQRFVDQKPEAAPAPSLEQRVSRLEERFDAMDDYIAQGREAAMAYISEEDGS